MPLRPAYILVITVVLTVAALGVASLSVYAYQVEGVFRYECALTPNLYYWDDEPIDANSTRVVLCIKEELTYGLVDADLARAVSPYPTVEAEYGFSRVLLDGHELLWTIEPRTGVEPAFDPSLHLDRVVTRITARGIDNGVCTLTYILQVNYVSVFSGIRVYDLWRGDHDHALLTVHLTMTNRTITGITYEHDPLVTTQSILLRNPTLLAVKGWLPMTLLGLGILIQTVTFYEYQRKRDRRTDDESYLQALYMMGVILWLTPPQTFHVLSTFL